MNNDIKNQVKHPWSVLIAHFFSNTLGYGSKIWNNFQDVLFVGLVQFKKKTEQKHFLKLKLKLKLKFKHFLKSKYEWVRKETTKNRWFA